MLSKEVKNNEERERENIHLYIILHYKILILVSFEIRILLYAVLLNIADRLYLTVLHTLIE